MFIWYLVSVVLWMAIFNFYIQTNAERIIENGWLDNMKHTPSSKGIILLVLVSAIPIFRAAIFCTIIYMSKHTKEEYEEWKNNHTGDDN